MLQESTNVRTMRSAVSSQLAVPWSRLKGFGDSVLSNAAPRLWNAMPGSITDCKSIGAVKKRIKTHLFKSASNYVLFIFLHICHVKCLRTACCIGHYINVLLLFLKGTWLTNLEAFYRVNLSF